MKALSPRERYAHFIETLTHCGTFLLALDEETIEYHMFEEFDGDCVSFLHEDNLSILEAEGLISPAVHRMATTLAKKFRALENTLLWDPRAVKTALEWEEILTLADRISATLRTK